MEELQEYLTHLKNYVGANIQFQGKYGNYIYQDPKTSQWFLIQPPLYILTEQRHNQLVQQKLKLNYKIQVLRNQIALTRDLEQNEPLVSEYNELCEDLKKVKTQLQGDLEILSNQISAIQLRQKQLQEENQELKKNLENLSSQIETAYTEAKHQDPESNWEFLNQTYKEKTDQIHQNQAEIQELQQQISELEISVFGLGTGQAPEVREISPQEKEEREISLEKIPPIIKPPKVVLPVVKKPKPILIKPRPLLIKPKPIVSVVPPTPVTIPKPIAKPIIRLKPTRIPTKPPEEIEVSYPGDIKKCNKGPALGGLPMNELKAVAKQMGIETTGLKKAEICELIRKYLSEEKVLKVPLPSVGGPFPPGKVPSLPVGDPFLLEKVSKTSEEIIIKPPAKQTKPAVAVCIRVSELRKTGYEDLENWMKDPENIYVGRRVRIWITNPITKERRMFLHPASKWGNPYKVGPGEYTLEESIRLYKERIETKPELINAIGELRGKRLGCFCKQDQSCHAQVLADLANKEI